jgi:Ca2+-binding RTX toxin-like protein
MRRVTLMLAAMALMVTLFAAAAYAATYIGTGQSDLFVGSNLNDTMYGRGGNDSLISDWTGNREVLKGGPGDDYIDALDDDTRDTINGGDGYDTCNGDKGDEFKRCEDVQKN